MSSLVVVDLFVEDCAHEEFLKAMPQRLAREAEKPISVERGFTGGKEVCHGQ